MAASAANGCNAKASTAPLSFTFGGPAATTSSSTATPPTDFQENTPLSAAPTKHVPAKRVHFADDSSATTTAAAATKRARPFAIDSTATHTDAAITKARADAEARIAEARDAAAAASMNAVVSSATAAAATECADQLQEEVARLRTQLAEAKNKAADGVAEVEAAWTMTKKELAKVRKDKADLEKVKDEKVALEQKVKDAAVGLRSLKECQRAKAEVEARADKADREVKALKRRCEAAEARVAQTKSSKLLEAEIASLRVELAAVAKEREAGVTERAALGEQVQRAKAAEVAAMAEAEAKLERARTKFVALTKDRDAAVAQRKTMAELLVRAEAKEAAAKANEAAAKAKVEEMGTKLAQMKRDAGKHPLVDTLKAKLVHAEEKIKKLEESQSTRVYAATAASASASSCLVNPSKWLAKAKAECDREKARADALQKQLDAERRSHAAAIDKAVAGYKGAGRMVVTADAATETDGACANVQQLTKMITSRIAEGQQTARARISVVRLTQLVALARIFKLKQQVAALSAAVSTPAVAKTDMEIQTDDVDFATEASESGDDQFTDMAPFVLSLDDEDSGAPASFASLPSTASTISTPTSWPRAAIPSGPWDPPTVIAVVEPPAAPKPVPASKPAAPKASQQPRHSPAFPSVPDPCAVPHVPHLGYYQAPPGWPMAYAAPDHAGSAVRGQHYPSYTAVPTAGGWVRASPHDAAAAAAAGWAMAPMWAVPPTADASSSRVASKPAKRWVETTLPTNGMPYPPPPHVRRARAADSAVDVHGMQVPPPLGFARRGVAAYGHGAQHW
ncbi:hypothetical protein AMAG_05639 [Allomyces macrogynus ATCC 38327]|uniref:Uncharacterized protein n=1 Tax=Allomyces macrogynus (strain ATCC 38327) TaxID=578462 RepID=A0A0L0SCQ9_ALLM3|nr:hypothetical protein AMAG_05639 [Allomyces macrogynus ATCC 38327]|eukprot:KNE60227.1 hypothetical protein AMAG_05639 [Allomyces macrogynus ATCC 38327]